MKRLVLIVGLMAPVAHAGVFTTEHVEAYPAEWPRLAGMSATCEEVQGAFVDSNRMRWEHEEYPGLPLGSKYGGTREAAWLALAFRPGEVRAEDATATARVFTIAFGADQAVVVRYSIDGQVVASKSFARDKWSCGSDGLTITTLERTGVVMDKFPNQGRTIRRSTFYRHGSYVYVKEVSETKARILHVLPQWFLNVHWFRFSEWSK